MWRPTLQKVHTSAPTILSGKSPGINVEANPSEGTYIHLHPRFCRENDLNLMWRLTLQKVHTSAPTILPGKLLEINVEANPSEGTYICTHDFAGKMTRNSCGGYLFRRYIHMHPRFCRENYLKLMWRLTLQKVHTSCLLYTSPSPRD